MIQRFFQFTILHLFCFLGGEEVEVQFQIEPFAIQAQGKETPIIFFYKTLLLDHREFALFIL